MPSNNSPMSKKHALTPAPAPLTKATANILPCHIAHDGPVPAPRRYWDPQPAPDAHLTSYLRGRRLRGRAIPLPPGYAGALLQGTTRTAADTALRDAAIAELEARRGELSADAYAEEEAGLREALASGELAGGDVHLVQSVARVDEVVVWGHERVPEAGGDAFARGVGEWVAVAAAVHEV